MNKKIEEKFQKIDCNDILEREFYPVWFFTNERIREFLSEIKKEEEIKKVFAVGGGGDFYFSLLSTPLTIEEGNLCDARQMANISIDIKIGLFKKLNYKEVLNLFLGQKRHHKEKVYEKIKNIITPKSRKILNSVIKESKKDDFLKTLKESSLWYKNSFWQVKNKEEYLPYLASEKKFQSLQKNLENITIYAGKFRDNLKLFQDQYYDLIYTSNILDTKKYCSHPDVCLKVINKKLSKEGLLFVITQKNPKKIINFIEDKDFLLYKKQIHKFNIFSSLFGHYSYSFLWFKKRD